MSPAAAAAADSAAAVWQRRYEREHQVRLEAENIAERGVRELYMRQRQLRLLQSIAAAANQSITFPEALGVALRKVARYLTWPMAHALVREGSGAKVRLVPSGIWHCDDPQLLPGLQRASEAGRDTLAAGLPGRVLATGKPAWLDRVPANANFPGSTVAREAGLMAAFAFPVLAQRRVVAVLEFFGTKFTEPGADVLDLMAQIGQQLGRVAERQRYQEKLQHDACHDPLTGLPNRTLMLDRLARAILHRQRHPGSHFSVLFIDLDRFKVVNDSLGHPAGDTLLQAAAQRLTAALRSSDALARPMDTLARLGGDEFTILLEDLRDVRDAARIAQRVQHRLEAPFIIGDQQIYVTASIGIAHSAGATSAEQILRDADLAMYRAKSRGSGGYAIYDDQMHARAVERLELETDLRNALQRQEFEVHYQPIMRLAGAAEWAGVEALVRWRRQDGTLVCPGDFISTAEETGLICPLGIWVLEEACRTLQAWRERFVERQNLTVSVNLSPRQMAQPDLVARVAEILHRSGLPPEAVHLEVTESVMLDNADRALAVLQELKALGVKLSLDDFGTGYSSLSYLHRYPFDIIKIDRSFIMELGHRQAADGRQAIVKTILRLAGSLDMEVIAEGAETRDHIARLHRLGCGLAQGFYFSPPLPAAELEKLLAAPSPAAG